MKQVAHWDLRNPTFSWFPLVQLGLSTDVKAILSHRCYCVCAEHRISTDVTEQTGRNEFKCTSL